MPDPVAELSVAAFRHQTDDLVNAIRPIREARSGGVNQLAQGIFVAHESLLPW
jgi:hypothetical protein